MFEQFTNGRQTTGYQVSRHVRELERVNFALVAHEHAEMGRLVSWRTGRIDNFA